jgi:hypothetical protein
MAAASASSAALLQQKQQHSLLKIPLLARVARFACNTAPSVFRFRMVHSVWEETLLDFKMHEPLFARLASADVPGRPDAVYSKFWLDAAALLPPPPRVDPATMLPVAAPSPYQSRASQLADPTLLAGLEQAIRHENEVVVPREYAATKREPSVLPARQRRLQQLGQLMIVFRGSELPADQCMSAFRVTKVDGDKLDEAVDDYVRQASLPPMPVLGLDAAYVIQLFAFPGGHLRGFLSVDHSMWNSTLGFLALQHRDSSLSNFVVDFAVMPCRQSLRLLVFHGCGFLCDLRTGFKPFAALPNITHLYAGENNFFSERVERPDGDGTAQDAQQPPLEDVVFYVRDLPRSLKKLILFNQCLSPRCCVRLRGRISFEGLEAGGALQEFLATGTNITVGDVPSHLKFVRFEGGTAA